MKRILLISCALAIGGLAFWLITAYQPRLVSPSPSERLSITTSIYPLWDLAKNISGEQALVTVITPLGVEPHEYEPTPGDIAKIYSSQLFIYNGNGVDSWAEKIATDIRAKGIPVLAMRSLVHSLGRDPHFWLDPSIVAQETNTVGETLRALDPKHADTYQKNGEQYENRLMALDAEYKKGLARCASKEIVTSHNAFQYLAHRYGLTSLFILGLSPDEEPSAKSIADITRIAKQKKINAIFFETLISPKLSQTIAAEIGVETLVLNPIENITQEEFANGESYISLMKKNLNNLQIALTCQNL